MHLITSVAWFRLSISFYSLCKFLIVFLKLVLVFYGVQFRIKCFLSFFTNVFVFVFPSFRYCRFLPLVIMMSLSLILPYVCLIFHQIPLWVIDVWIKLFVSYFCKKTIYLVISWQIWKLPFFKRFIIVIILILSTFKALGHYLKNWRKFAVSSFNNMKQYRNLIYSCKKFRLPSCSWGIF